MNLNLKILSNRPESNTNGQSICYMCEGNLKEYVDSIPSRYTDYDVQRGIVSNVYLDNLALTILNGKFIPPIVLVALGDYTLNDDNTITISEYKILDGLQRSYRIKAIYNALELYIAEVDKGIDLSQISKFKLSRTYKEYFEKKDTTATILLTIIKWVEENNTSTDELKLIYPHFIQWFEIWVKIDKKEQINKMLLLNAGHKPMDIKHQLELLFLNIIPSHYLSSFIRAKDINSSFFYNKKTVGQLHLSHFISALLSFNDAKPITVDAKFIQSLQNDLDTELEKIKHYFENKNLELLIDFTKRLDDLFYKEYQDEGIQWLGRETVLAGLFSAFGKYYKINEDNITFKECLFQIEEKITKNIKIFNINQFNDAKKTSIDITKVNIGNIFKYTTFNVMSKLLIDDETNVDWDKTFKFGTKAYDDC